MPALCSDAAADFTERCSDFLYVRHDVRHRRTGALYQFSPSIDVTRGVGDQIFDLPRRLGAAQCQCADLSGHYRKTSTLLACAGGFHGRVECQNVGLGSDSVNHANDVLNVRDEAAAISPIVDTTSDYCTALLGDVRCLLSHLAGSACGVRGVAHRPGQFFHRSSCLLQVRCSLLRPS